MLREKPEPGLSLIYDTRGKGIDRQEIQRLPASSNLRPDQTGESIRDLGPEDKPVPSTQKYRYFDKKSFFKEILPILA